MKPGERLMPIREITQQDDSTFLGKAAAEPAARPQVREGAARETLLKVEHVSKSLAIRQSGIFGREDGGLLAVDGVRFSVGRCECSGQGGETRGGQHTPTK